MLKVEGTELGGAGFLGGLVRADYSMATATKALVNRAKPPATICEAPDDAEVDEASAAEEPAAEVVAADVVAEVIRETPVADVRVVVPAAAPVEVVPAPAAALVVEPAAAADDWPTQEVDVPAVTET